MPVDLSMIGIKGAMAAQETLNSIANREALKVQTDAAQHKLEDEQHEEAVSAQIAQQWEDLSRGTPPAPDGSNLPQDDSARFDFASQGFFNAGLFTRSQAFAEAAGKIRQERATTRNTNANADQTRLENIWLTADTVANHMGQNENEFAVFQQKITNPPNEEWAIVARTLGADAVNLLQNTQWTPDLANYFRSMALTTKDKAELDLRQQGYQLQVQAHSDLQADRAARLRLQAARDAETANYHNRVASNSGANAPAIKPPDANQRSAIEDLLRTSNVYQGIQYNENGSIADPDTADDFNRAVVTIAGQVEQLKPDHPGLTYAQLAQIAITRAQMSGQFSRIPTVQSGRIFGSEVLEDKPARVEFGRMGSRAHPMEYPADDKDLRPYRYYNIPTPDGGFTPMLWNGKEWKGFND